MKDSPNSELFKACETIRWAMSVHITASRLVTNNEFSVDGDYLFKGSDVDKMIMEESWDQLFAERCWLNAIDGAEKLAPLINSPELFGAVQTARRYNFKKSLL